MEDAGFTKEDLVDLMIAHTIGGQETINPSMPVSIIEAHSLETSLMSTSTRVLLSTARLKYLISRI